MASSRKIHALRHPLSIDPALGELARETEYAAHVEQMIRQVLFTSPGERVNRPDFGCGLKQMVFAPNADGMVSLLKVHIQRSLDRWLGSLIRLDDVTTRAEGAVLRVTIVYMLKARQERRYLNLELAI
jgi:phage baseplate assembly protein W